MVGDGVRIKAEFKVKGSGQECPLHTGELDTTFISAPSTAARYGWAAGQPRAAVPT